MPDTLDFNFHIVVNKIGSTKTSDHPGFVALYIPLELVKSYNILNCYLIENKYNTYSVNANSSFLGNLSNGDNQIPDDIISTWITNENGYSLLKIGAGSSYPSSSSYNVDISYKLSFTNKNQESISVDSLLFRLHYSLVKSASYSSITKNITVSGTIPNELVSQFSKVDIENDSSGYFYGQIFGNTPPNTYGESYTFDTFSNDYDLISSVSSSTVSNFSNYFNIKLYD